MLRLGVILSRLWNRHHSRAGLPAPVRALVPWLVSGAAHLGVLGAILLSGWLLVSDEWEHEVARGKPITLSMLAAAPETMEVEVTLETPVEIESPPEPTPAETPLDRFPVSLGCARQRRDLIGREVIEIGVVVHQAVGDELRHERFAKPLDVHRTT